MFLYVHRMLVYVYRVRHLLPGQWYSSASIPASRVFFSSSFFKNFLELFFLLERSSPGN